MNDKTYETITYILLHIVVLAIFLTVFFFTYSVTVEKDIVVNQIDFLMDDIFGNFFKGIPQEDKDNITNQLNELMEGSDSAFEQQDEEVIENNNKIIKKSLIFLIIIVAVIVSMITIVFIMKPWTNSNKKQYLIACVVTLLFVGITEVVFLLLIAKNYLSLDPNNLKENIVEELYKNRKLYIDSSAEEVISNNNIELSNEISDAILDFNNNNNNNQQ